MKRLSLVRTLLPLLAGLLLAVPARSARAADPTPPPNTDDNGYAEIGNFARAIELIRQDYVDGDKVSYHDLLSAAMKGMLSSLDPHSQFMDPDDFKDMQNDTRSRFNGLGVEVAMKDGVLTVVTPMEGTPAAKAGILAGDEILKINGISTEKLDLEDAVDVLRGKPDQKVTLTILRPSNHEIKDFALQRKEIKVQSVKGARLLSPELTGPYKVGYVRIVQFNEPTAAEFGKTLDDLQKQGMQALVLDLRNNPGGLLNSAVDVLGQFLPPNTKVVSTQGRAYSQKHDYSTSVGVKERPHFPLVVLVNEGSASGSEIVAGALKDLHRAIIVGETTFGKGSVQNVMQLPDGSALRFTTAKYFTPSRQVIQGNGVVPNIRVPLTLAEERAVAALRNNDKITPEEAVSIIKSQDRQLMRGIDALKGVMIYAQQTAPKVDAVKK
ncbi:MAG TPA: S41 family peptidase [Chthoniobacterales bacterium]|jgi:carboxyl-terminal processing protease